MSPPHNFSAGPGALPETVLIETQKAIRKLPEVGISLLGISHRSDWFSEVLKECDEHVRALLQLPKHYHVLWLQGGGSLQFSMIPMSFLRGRRQAAEYINSGYWSGKSIVEARREGAVRLLWNGEKEGFSRLPRRHELDHTENATYFHYVSNETVEGLQFSYLPGLESVPRLCDMSSDLFSRPIDVERFALIYAHAQKNLGPAGVTLVLLRDDLLPLLPENLHSTLDYRSHISAGSIHNTPPVFAIYVVLLVLRWLRYDVGALGAMAEQNQAKADLLYRVLDQSAGFYRGRAAVESRSQMNVTFNLKFPVWEQTFLRDAERAGLHGLAGHRSVGGVRASLYNAVNLEAVNALCDFMENFQRRWRLRQS